MPKFIARQDTIHRVPYICSAFRSLQCKFLCTIKDGNSLTVEIEGISIASLRISK